MSASKRKAPAPTGPVPQAFIREMEKLLGAEEAARLAEAIDGTPSVSIRLNRRKAMTGPEERVRYGTPVPWCESGLYLDSRPDFILDPLLHAGVYYVQEAASMVYEETLATLLAGRPKGPLRILDLCAAPGGKSTAMLNAVARTFEGDDYLLVANEFDRKRVQILKENLDKWGDPNVIITNSSTDAFARLGETFDIVAVDAPCSGEGMMRREPAARSQWSESLVRQCAGLQREILRNAACCLKPGGWLIYSTCTFNRTENEDNAHWLQEEFGLEPVEEPQRFMPHRERCEGLFAATFCKPEGESPAGGVALRSREATIVRLKSAGIRIVSSGIEHTVAKGTLEIPSSRSVLASDYVHGTYPEVELTDADAQAYIRRLPLVLPPETPKGYVCVCYRGHPLGLVKNLGNRANNLFPAEWRVLK